MKLLDAIATRGSIKSLCSVPRPGARIAVGVPESERIVAIINVGGLRVFPMRDRFSHLFAPVATLALRRDTAREEKHSERSWITSYH